MGSQLDQIPDGCALELHPDGRYSGVLDWGVVLSAVAAAARALSVALFWQLVGLAPRRDHIRHQVLQWSWRFWITVVQPLQPRSGLLEALEVQLLVIAGLIALQQRSCELAGWLPPAFTP